MKNRSMMKWRVRRDSRCSSADCEDIRRSLEVLDNVLAEYDDSWTSNHPFMNGSDSVSEDSPESTRLFAEKGGKWIPTISHSASHHELSSYDSALDGSTSHSSYSSYSEQVKVSSPPPIPPKRSPATRLSDRNSVLFNFASDTTSMDSDDSMLSSETATQLLHLASPITRCSPEISASPQDDEVFEERLLRFQDCAKHCVVCGSELDMAKFIIGSREAKDSFEKRCQVFDETSHVPVRRVASSQSAFKNGVTLPESGSDKLRTPPQRFTSFRTPPANRKYEPSPKTSRRVACHACEEKIRELDSKFSEVRHLIKLNIIQLLQTEPPPFKPPPPPIPHDSLTYDLMNDACQCDSDLDDSEKLSQHRGARAEPWKSKHSLCDKCSKLVLSETIEDLPNLTPTDALNRPQLGLTYLMEDDLSPGVKEIRTSTPKSNATSLRFSPQLSTKEPSCLSTFSHSSNSLGYVSSQSDLELNVSISNGSQDKVPVTSLKSQTLPIGMKLTPSPFYSNTDQSYENNYRSHISNFKLSSHSPDNDLELRSSSAPPLPPKMEKKKISRGFCKKEKKKNEDNLSVKSDFSMDEGIILKRIDALDGSSDLPDYVEKNEDSEEKPKKRSVWKSILRRK